MNKLKKIKQQLWFILIFIYNLIYNWLPFFRIKKIFLKLFGNKIGNNSFIHTPVKFFNFNGLLLGNNCTINPSCYLDTRKGISIGNNVNISHCTKIYTLGHDVNFAKLPGRGKSVIIEDDVFIFANVLIMPGVRIGKGAVVFPGSVVIKDVTPYTMVGGNPAKFVKKRSEIESQIINYGFWYAQ